VRQIKLLILVHKVRWNRELARLNLRNLGSVPADESLRRRIAGEHQRQNRSRALTEHIGFGLAPSSLCRAMLSGWYKTLSEVHRQRRQQKVPDTGMLLSVQLFDVGWRVVVDGRGVPANRLREFTHQSRITAPRFPHIDRYLLRSLYPEALLEKVQHDANVSICIDEVRTRHARCAHNCRQRRQLNVRKVVGRCTEEKTKNGANAESLPVAAWQQP
jgi:hypothetical protein